MTWLQDINWPAAQVIAPFLAAIGLPLVPYICQVFATEDEVWKVRVTQELVKTSPAVFAQEVLDHYGRDNQNLALEVLG